MTMKAEWFGLFWGRRLEGGIWLARCYRLRWLTGGDRLFYLAFGRWRVRVMR